MPKVLGKVDVRLLVSEHTQAIAESATAIAARKRQAVRFAQYRSGSWLPAIKRGGRK